MSEHTTEEWVAIAARQLLDQREGVTLVTDDAWNAWHILSDCVERMETELMVNQPFENDAINEPVKNEELET